MRFISAFSGMGGFDLALEAEGFTPVLQIENNRDCLRVLEHHWPNVKRRKDIRRVRGKHCPTADVVCGGFPCQDLSVAGKRAGLAGARSGLFWEFARILGEVRPWGFLLENVPGLFSSWSPVEPPPRRVGLQTWHEHDGRDPSREVEEESDFGIIVSTLVELGYGVAWRVLDSQYFGVAQRRDRVFFVGIRGDGTGLAAQAPGEDLARLAILSAQILFDPESCDWDSSPGGISRTDIAATIGAGLAKSRHDQDGYPEALVAATFGVRRLTPTECLRLQGFPDDWLDLTPLSDSAKYRMTGNAVTIQPVRWIARRMRAVRTAFSTPGGSAGAAADGS